MNQPDSRLGEIGKVMYAFRISLAHENHEWRFIDDLFLRQRAPVGLDVAVVFQALRIAFDRENRDLRFHAGDDLVGYGFRSGERRGEANIETMLSFHFGGERRIDRFLERFFHDRKTINSNVDAAARLSGRSWQTSVYGQQSENRNGDNRSSSFPQPHGHLTYRRRLHPKN